MSKRVELSATIRHSGPIRHSGRKDRMVSMTALGRVSGSLAEQLASLNSPAAIAGEIARLEEAIKGGDASAATRVLLKDWQAVARAQRRLLAQEGETEGADA
jgi:hypothetical protein